MELFSFTPASEEPGEPRQDTTQKAIQNLLNHLPAEATGLYLAGLNAVGDEAGTAAVVAVAVVSLAVLLLVRWLAKASTNVIIASVLGFVIWVYAIGNGPFQAFGVELVQGLGTFAIIAYSTIITILATAGKI